MHGGNQRALCRPALGEESDHQAGEHITHAGAGHAGVATGVDEPAPVGGGDDGAAALQYRQGAVALCDVERGLQAIGLHCGGADAQHACGFGRVRGEDAGRGAACQNCLQLTIGTDQIEGVGVEHQRDVAFQRGPQQCRRTGFRAQAGADRERAQAFGQMRGAAQHQFRVGKINGGAVGVEQADEDTTRAQPERGAPGEQGRTDHAGVAAENAGIAIEALVAVARTRLELVPEQGGRDGLARCGEPGGGIDVEALDLDLTAVVGAVVGQQAGFERNEGGGVSGTKGGAVGLSGVGVEPAGHVERQARRRLGVEGLDPASVAALDGALEADTEQGVDHQCPAVGGRCRQIGNHIASSRGVIRMGLGGISWQGLSTAGKGDLDLTARLS